MNGYVVCTKINKKGDNMSKGSNATPIIVSALFGVAAMLVGGPIAVAAGGVGLIGGCVVGRVLRSAIGNRKRKPKDKIYIDTSSDVPRNFSPTDPPTPLVSLRNSTPVQRRRRLRINRYGEIEEI